VVTLSTYYPACDPGLYLNSVICLTMSTPTNSSRRRENRDDERARRATSRCCSRNWKKRSIKTPTGPMYVLLRWPVIVIVWTIVFCELLLYIGVRSFVSMWEWFSSVVFNPFTRKTYLRKMKATSFGRWADAVEELDQVERKGEYIVDGCDGELVDQLTVRLAHVRMLCETTARSPQEDISRCDIPNDTSRLVILSTFHILTVGPRWRSSSSASRRLASPILAGLTTRSCIRLTIPELQKLFTTSCTR
jgi:hypothetical protein